MNAPEKIYLQWWGDGEPDEDAVISEYDVTHSLREPVFTHDVEYTRSDLHKLAMQDMAKLHNDDVERLSDARADIERLTRERDEAVDRAATLGTLSLKRFSQIHALRSQLATCREALEGMMNEYLMNHARPPRSVPHPFYTAESALAATAPSNAQQEPSNNLSGIDSKLTDRDTRLHSALEFIRSAQPLTPEAQPAQEPAGRWVVINVKENGQIAGPNVQVNLEGQWVGKAPWEGMDKTHSYRRWTTKPEGGV